MTFTGGRTVSRSSPQVMSKSAEISKKKNEIEPVPLARHGLGPDRANRSEIENTPTPNALSDTEACTSMMNMKGENWNRASNPMWPSMPNPPNPKNRSACAPNCAVLLVTAK